MSSAQSNSDLAALKYYYQHNFIDFVEATGVIGDESGNLQRLVMSESQWIRARVFQQLYDFNQCIQIVDLKARQVYASTIWTKAAQWLHWKSEGPRKTAIIAPEYDKTDNLMKMFEIYTLNMPEHLQKPLANKKFNEYADSGAIVKMFTARNLTSGRSGNYQTIVKTEPPFYPHANELNLSLNRSVRKDIAHNFIVDESTANGYDEYFKPYWDEVNERVQKLCKKHNAIDQYDLIYNKKYWDNDVFPIFTGWLLMQKYSRDPALERLHEGNITPLEKGYMKMGATLAQLAWRRKEIRDISKIEEYNDDLEGVFKFMQEYPATPEEAFQSTNHCVIDVSIVTVMRETARLYEKEGVERNGKIMRAHRCSIEFEKDHEPLVDPRTQYITNYDDLRVKAYKRPISECDFLLYSLPKLTHVNRYVIGADVSEGFAQGDYSVAFVYDRVEMFFPCMFRAHVDEFTFARILTALGVFYNDAWILVERNATGKTVLKKLQQFYTNLLHETSLATGYEESTKHLGFFTNDQSKPYIVSLLTELIQNKKSAILFEQFWIELSTFTRDKNGKMGAEGKRLNKESKNFDDSVMSPCLALKANELAPPIEIISPVVTDKHLLSIDKRKRDDEGLSMLDGIEKYQRLI